LGIGDEGLGIRLLLSRGEKNTPDKIKVIMIQLFSKRRLAVRKRSISLANKGCGTSRNVKRFRGGLVFEAHRLLYHSTLGSRVIKKKKKKDEAPNLTSHIGGAPARVFVRVEHPVPLKPKNAFYLRILVDLMIYDSG